MLSADDEEAIKARIIQHDDEGWDWRTDLQHVAAVDVAYETDHAVAALVECSFPDLVTTLEVVRVFSFDQLPPYVPGYLSLREGPLITVRTGGTTGCHDMWASHDPGLSKLCKCRQELYDKYLDETRALGRSPAQVVFVDGNGVWHPRGIGLASYFGVLSDVRSIGLAKNVLVLPDSTLSLSRDGVMEEGASEAGERAHLADEPLAQQCERALTETGKYAFVLSIKEQDHRAAERTRIGVAVRCGQQSTKPAWVSVGHRLSLESAADIVCSIVRKGCQESKVFDPIRRADILANRKLREAKVN